MELFNSCGKKTHRYSTRYRNLPNIKKHKSEEYKKSFLCKSLTYIKEIDKRIANAKNRTKFIQKYKDYIFAN